MRTVSPSIIRILLCTLFIAISCTEENPDPTPNPPDENDSITIIGESNLVFSCEQGNTTLSFKASSAWTITTDAEWCTVSPSTGGAGKVTATVYVKANNQYDDLNCTLTIKAGKASALAHVTQAKKDALVIAETQYDFPPEGGTLEVSASTNIEQLSVTIAEEDRGWIVYQTTKGLREDKLRFSIATASEAIDRTGTITISGKGLSQTISVHQYSPQMQTAVVFKDDAFQSFCLEHFDSNHDGIVSLAEAYYIENVDIRTDNIRSMEGIEAFKQLKWLSANGTQWRSGKLEMLDLSQNTNLEGIYVYDNQLKELTLPLSQNLKKVIAYNNVITRFDFGSLESLEEISIGSNSSIQELILPQKADNLTTLFLNDDGLDCLDVSPYPNLSSFYCYGNPIGQLNVRNNLALKDFRCNCETMMVLFVQNGQVLEGITQNRSTDYINENTEIFYGNPEEYTGKAISIKDPVFKAWLVEHYDRNHDGEIGVIEALDITSIDMTTKEVSSLEGIEYLTNLESLVVKGGDEFDGFNPDAKGKLSSVDLSKNVELRHLNLRLNKLTAIDLSHNNKINDINLYGTDIKSLDLSPVTLLEHMDLGCCHMESLNLRGLNKLIDMWIYANDYKSIDLSSLQNAETISLDWCDNLQSVTFPGEGRLVKFYCRNSAIQKLDVSQLDKLKELWCSSPRTEFLYISESQSLEGITQNRSEEYIHPTTTVIVGNAGEDHLIVDNHSFEIGPDGGLLEIPIIADNEVSISKDADWINVENADKFKSGTLLLRVSSMPHGQKRSTVITLQAGSLKEYINVIQHDTDWIAVTAIALNKTSLELKKGQNETLIVNVSPDNASDKTVIWASENDAIASVDQNGKVTALKSGSVTITAQAGEKNAICEVTVITPVESVFLDRTSVSLAEGQTTTLVATISPNDADEKTVEWVTSNSSVATVSNGVVVALTEGSAVITAKAGGKSASCSVSVVKSVVTVTSITLNKTSLNLKKGQSETLVATVKPDNATDKSVSWSSSDNTIASVNQNGKVTALKSGNVIITAKAGEKSATCSVTITTPVESVSLNQTSVDLEVGQTTTLVASINPSDADEKTVEWITSNVAVATVADGVVTAVSAGNAIITAKAGGKSATCSVTVTATQTNSYNIGDIVNSDGVGIVVWASDDRQSYLLMSVKEPQKDTWTVSNDWCNSYGSQWRMPTIDELTLIHNSFSVINTSLSQHGYTKLTTGNYCHWSSTVNPSNSNYFYRERLHDGTIFRNTGSDERIDSKANYTRAVKTIGSSFVSVESISLNQTEASLNVGATITLYATVLPNNATNKTVTWSCSDATIASVDQNGKVTALKVGKCTITATAGGKTATCAITVQGSNSVAVTSVSLNKTSLFLSKGQSETLIATVNPDNATDKSVSWSSSDNTIASVDQNGKVTAIAEGNAFITASAGEKSATCLVTVTASQTNSYNIGDIVDSDGVGVVVWVSNDGGSALLMSVTEPAQDTWNNSNTWCTSYGNNWRMPTIDELTLIHNSFLIINSSFYQHGYSKLTTGDYCHWSCTVNPSNSDYFYRERLHDGTIRAFTGADEHKNSTANYTRAVKTIGGTSSVSVESIILSQTRATLATGVIITLYATVLPDNATNKTVTWSSSDATIASVDQNGKVTALMSGNCTITATAGGKSASCTVKVITDPEAVDLGLSVKWASWNLGATKPEDNGDYYAWGETEPKDDYTWITYIFCNSGSYKALTKYNKVGDKTEFKDYNYEDDAARRALGGKWRTPTDEEWLELIEQCTWTKTTQNGVKGRLATSKINGNSIFFPFAGFRHDKSLGNEGSNGYYWSSSLGNSFSYRAWDVQIDNGPLNRENDRYYGLSVRPVKEYY